MIDDKQILSLKQQVIARAKDPSFRHHQWFVQYHLDIVAQVADELCARHPEANKQFVAALVWLHDYEKIIDFDNQYNTELAGTKKLLEQLTFTDTASDALCKSLIICNAKQNLASASIEIQIVSSADAASHLVGPFITLYWYEHPSQTIGELQQENRRKLTVDWETKMVLPEVRQKFADRHQLLLEIAGEIPASFLA